MGASGYIDWHRLDNTMPWVRQRTGQHTYVYAYWLVDYGRTTRDRGVSILKGENLHPDWFIHARTADHVLDAYAPPSAVVSPNFTSVFRNKLRAEPLLAAALLGNADAVYHNNGQMWWAATDDLTRRGKRLLKAMNQLYERDAVLITFIDMPSDEKDGPRDPG